MSAEEQSPPFASQVAAVARWLDGEGAKFLSRDQRRPGAAKVWEIQLQHPALRGRDNVRIVLPRGFPVRAPRIEVDKSLCLVLPHVEETGRVCLGKLNETNAYSNPERSVYEALLAFDEFLEKCNDLAWITAEFEREAIAYWNRFCQSNLRRTTKWRVRQLVSAVGSVNSVIEGQVAIYEAGRIGVAAPASLSPNSLARRYGLSQGTLKLARAVHLPIPNSVCWTPIGWPQTFLELASLADEASSGTFDLATWCAADPEGVPAGFVFLTGAHSVFAYQLTSPWVPRLGFPEIVPVEVTRIDPDWALVRDQSLERIQARRKTRILLLGCGSIGAPIAVGLAKAGVQDLTLVDMEDLMPENVSRHPLGMHSVFESKSTALAKQLNGAIPGVSTKPHRAMAADWILAQGELRDVTLVIDCTGEASVRRFLGEVRKDVMPDTPVVHVWLEPYGAASHVVLVDKDTVWPENDPVEKIHVVKWHEDTRIVLPACNSGFHEYGASDAEQAAATACECILSILDSPTSVASKVWSSIRSTGYVESFGEPEWLSPLVPVSNDTFPVNRITRSLKDVFDACEEAR